MTSQCVTLTPHQIQYSANATQSEEPDPGKPVALDHARAESVPGLMIITKRAQ